jgi:hydroxymethylglutaryl-CoA lyase
MTHQIELVEVGPRDGLQNEAKILGIDARVELIERLVENGVRRLESVSFVRPDVVPQMAGAEEVMAQVSRRPDLTHIGLVLNRYGAERAAAVDCDEINVVVPVTDAFSTRNQNRSVAQMIDQASEAVDVARSSAMSVSITLAVAFGCPFSGEVGPEAIRSVYDRVIALGPDEVVFADTIGVGTPSQVRRFAELSGTSGDTPRLRFHFHNTRNTGYANAWAALDHARARGTSVALDASVGGFGGCPFAPAATGNVATEDLAYLMRREGFASPVDLLGTVETATWLGKELDRPVDALLDRAGDFGVGDHR